MTAPTAAEEKLLIEFRERVGDVLKTKEQREDSYLVRWLRARELDLKKSEDMLRTSLKWREENSVSEVLMRQLDPFFEKEFPYYIDIVDKHNQPVIFVPIGKWDFRKVVNSKKTEEFKLFLAHMFETLLLHIRARNKGRDPDLYPITQLTAVVDWSGYSYMQMVNIKAVQTMLQLGAVYEAHYPEILFRAFFINCPSFFNLVLALLKPVIAPKTLGKIGVHGSKTDWEPCLLEEIDQTELSKIIKRLS